jgi:5'-nucleotidase
VDSPLPGDQQSLTVLCTADLHGRLFGSWPTALSPEDELLGLHQDHRPFGGAARLAYVLARERARATRSLLLDAGDWTGPAWPERYSGVARGELEAQVMALLGYDAVLWGPAEQEAAHPTPWPRGPTVLLAADRVASAEAPVLPFTIVHRGGLRIGVIGLGGGADALDAYATLTRLVTALHAEVDLVVVLSHLGLAAELALVQAGVPDVDVICGGADHHALGAPLEVPTQGGRTVLVWHDGAFGYSVGRLDLTLGRDHLRHGWRVLAHASQVFPVDARLAGHDDSAVTELLAAERHAQAVTADLDRVIAYAPEPLAARQGGDGDFEHLIADAALAWSVPPADVAVIALGAEPEPVRWGPGPVRRRAVRDLDLAGVPLWQSTVSGRELEALVLALSQRAAREGCALPAAVAGVAWQLDCDSGTASAIVVGGKALSQSAVYRLQSDEATAVSEPALSGNTSRRFVGYLGQVLEAYIATGPSCGAYEVTQGQDCWRSERTAMARCRDVVDCGRYSLACEQAAATPDPNDGVPMPLVCGGGGQDPNNCGADAANTVGPFAGQPCVVAQSVLRVRVVRREVLP